MTVTIHQGDALEVLQRLPGSFVNCVVTSPPYWGLRDYGVKGQLGLEKSPEAYVTKMVEVFREVRRVLRNDGTLWLNLGDSYNNDRTGGHGLTGGIDKSSLASPAPRGASPTRKSVDRLLKPKDLVGIPWRLAFALQADGWFLRMDIIWAKPNPMPESVTDRPTRAHEYVFLLSKSKRYFFDAEAIKEPGVYAGPNGAGTTSTPYGQGFTRRTKEQEKARQDKQRGHGRRHAGFNERWDQMSKEEQTNVMRNKRSVWTISTEAFPDAHFATFPKALVEPCIKAGCPGGGIVLDPFAGSGTVGLMAERLNRNAVLIELNPEYVKMAKRRIERDSPMFAKVEVAA